MKSTRKQAMVWVYVLVVAILLYGLPFIPALEPVESPVNAAPSLQKNCLAYGTPGDSPLEPLLLQCDNQLFWDPALEGVIQRAPVQENKDVWTFLFGI